VGVHRMSVSEYSQRNNVPAREHGRPPQMRHPIAFRCALCARVATSNTYFQPFRLCNVHFRGNLRRNRRQVSVALMGMVHIRGVAVVGPHWLVFVKRVRRLTLLAPESVGTILNGCHPNVRLQACHLGPGTEDGDPKADRLGYPSRLSVAADIPFRSQCHTPALTHRNKS
jgi:hypothetical protein